MLKTEKCIECKKINIMATAGYNTRNRVACAKCKQRHKPPVGASCPRQVVKAKRPSVNKNINQNMVNLGTIDAAGRTNANKNPATQQGQASACPSVSQHDQQGGPSTAEVMDKLNQFMDKFSDIEQRLERQERKSSSGLSILSEPSAHSSPKGKEPRHRRQQLATQTSPRTMPSMDYLRTDSEVQAEVDRRLRAYEDVSREDNPGASGKLKSGRYRLGDQRVKKLVHWPHEFCAVGDNLKMPSYEDINIFQWVQGFSRCILEEEEPQNRAHMLQYQANLMQDALELNWNTAKRAHAAVLTEMERGHVTWADQMGVDRIRQRFTQRAIKITNSSNSDEQTRICKRYNEENCSQPRDHVDGKVTYKHSCFACFKAVKRHYPHTEAKCNRAKRIANASSDKQRI